MRKLIKEVGDIGRGYYSLLLQLMRV